MAAFLARRLLLAVLVLVAVSFGSFWFFARNFYIAPETQLPVPPATAWWHWFKGIPHGSIGKGVFGNNLWPALVPALVHTLVLLAAAFVLVVVFALVLGVVSAVRAGSALDVALRTVAYVSWGLPAFLLALVLQKATGILLVYAHLPMLPLRGWPGTCALPAGTGFSGTPGCGAEGWEYVWQVARHLVLPAVALATSFVGMHARYVRSQLLVTLAAPFVTKARAKGLSEPCVVVRHALRLSVVTFASALLLDFGSVFGASLAVDWVFSLGGIGSLFIQTIGGETLDPLAVQLILVVTAALVLLASMLADVTTAWLDPRVRLR
jgi:peptide/nickel transport system permease protein